MQTENEPRRSGELLAVFANGEAAQKAMSSLLAEGVPRTAVSIADSNDEVPSLRAEMREELNKAWVLPQAAFTAPKEGARSFVFVTLVACAIALVVGVPLAFVDFGMSFWTRLLVVEGVLLAAAFGIGITIGAALGAKRPDEAMAAQRGVTLRVRLDDERTRQRLMAANAIRIDQITTAGEPISTLTTEEDRAGGQGLVTEVVKAAADITSNLDTDDFHPPTDRGTSTDAMRPEK